MKKSTTLAGSIDAAAQRAQYDAVCKNILSEKIILAWIMKNTMEEFKDCTVWEIAGKYIEGTPQVATAPILPDETNVSRIPDTGVEDVTITEGTITFDIRFMAILPDTKEHVRMIINLEAQNDYYPGYPLIKRAIYYCSRLISSQYGTEFTNSHYEKIKKVYSIWICTNPPQNRKNTITRYSFTETQIVGNVHEKTENYDLMTVIMIGLGDDNSSIQKYSRETAEGMKNDGYQEKCELLRLLNVLLSNATDTVTKKDILSKDFNIPMTERFERRMDDMCNLSKGVWEKGIEQGIISSIKNIMTSLSMTAEQAMDVLKLSDLEKSKYAAMLDIKENKQ